jgi:phosphopantothenoylcysteine decarboxylase/phosphopantothenate--cysteine ligase
LTERDTHPSKDITGTAGKELAGKRVVLCVTGSVAAYRAIDLARLLMRHGADVRPVMSGSTGMMVSPEMMKWATGNPAVSSLSGDLEHVALADFGRSDLIVVYPCTANTIGKAANGIDDTPVTSVLSVALGSKIPVIVAPAMHEAMIENAAVAQNIGKLKQAGVIFCEPLIVEGKAKAAEPQEVLQLAISTLSPKPLAGKKVLVTAGSTIEYIDPIRVVTNLSSGKMGIAIAQQASAMGAKVTLILGVGVEPPRFEKILRVKTSSEMYDAVVSELKSEEGGYDVAVMTAAVSDFKPSKKSASKIDTRKGSLELRLEPTKKIINEVKKISSRTVLVAFKAEWGLDRGQLVEKAKLKLDECNADLVVANDLALPGASAGSDTTEVLVVGRTGRPLHMPLASKVEVAQKLVQLVAEVIDKNSK